MSEKQFYFQLWTRENKSGPLQWRRQPGAWPSFAEAQAAAIADGRRPYRIRSEVKPAQAVV